MNIKLTFSSASEITIYCWGLKKQAHIPVRSRSQASILNKILRSLLTYTLAVMCLCVCGKGGSNTALNAWKIHEAATISTEHKKTAEKKCQQPIAASFCCCRRHGLWFPRVSFLTRYASPFHAIKHKHDSVSATRGDVQVLLHVELSCRDQGNGAVCVCTRVCCILVIVTCLSVCVFICEGQSFTVVLFWEAQARCHAVSLNGDERCLVNYGEAQM